MSKKLPFAFPKVRMQCTWNEFNLGVTGPEGLRGFEPIRNRQLSYTRCVNKTTRRVTNVNV